MLGPVIWVEGLIGAGKSTLTQKLSEELKLRPVFEPVDSNPYLERFYVDPKRWAFPMQMHLLHYRYNMQQIAAREALGGMYRGAILDRGLPGDRVFCKLHQLYGNISDLEWYTYELAYATMACSLVPPSLLVFLDVEPEIAFERVKRRNRAAETTLTLEYLQNLRKGYLDMISEVEGGEHAWSRGLRILRVPWNQDYLPTVDLIASLKQQFHL